MATEKQKWIKMDKKTFKQALADEGLHLKSSERFRCPYCKKKTLSHPYHANKNPFALTIGKYKCHNKKCGMRYD